MLFPPKQGLARIKAVFSTPNYRVHIELYIFPPSLTALLRGLCGQTLKTDDSCDSTLAK